MVTKGVYKLTYTLDGVLCELEVIVELKPIVGMMKPKQNVYTGVVYVDGSLYLKENLENCVNAKIAAEEIGEKLRDELKKNCRVENKSYRFKKEEIK